jgi:hypothetical protein
MVASGNLILENITDVMIPAAVAVYWLTYIELVDQLWDIPSVNV